LSDQPRASVGKGKASAASAGWVAAACSALAANLDRAAAVDQSAAPAVRSDILAAIPDPDVPVMEANLGQDGRTKAAILGQDGPATEAGLDPGDREKEALAVLGPDAAGPESEARFPVED
jgi:hypothetical protein